MDNPSKTQTLAELREIEMALLVDLREVREMIGALEPWHEPWVSASEWEEFLAEHPELRAAEMPA